MRSKSHQVSLPGQRLPNPQDSCSLRSSTIGNRHKKIIPFQPMPSTMKSFLRVSALSWFLSHVAAQAGKPESILSYKPSTDVRDQARIDLDQKLIRTLVEDYKFETAEKIYQEGAFSKSVSSLTLAEPLSIDIPQGANLTGTSTSGSPVAVFAQGMNYTAGATSIAVQYRDEGCYVGANPDPVVTGCLASNGTLTDDASGTSIAYTYKPEDSYNVYSIQYFTQGTEFVFEEGAPYTVDFQKFVDYYGSANYADDIITAAFQKTKTSFTNGNFDASSLGDAGRAQMTKKGTSYMAVMMYVLRELEHAIYLCETGACGEESCLGKAPDHEVDEAVAFYAGSLANATEAGELMFNLAEDRAVEFQLVKGDSDLPAAPVNIAMFKAFDSAQKNIQEINCAGLRADTTEVSRLMTIPLVQGTLKYSSLTKAGLDKDEDWDDHVAERVIFSLSILPYVYSCNATDAEIIYEHTKLDSTNVDFEAIEQAFTDVYGCLNITSEDIGTVPGSDDSKDTPDGGSGTEAPNGDGGGGGNGSGATMAGWVLGMISVLVGMI